MSSVLAFAPGGYRYIRGVFQYSAGVAAEPGFALERARFLRPPPLAEGFAAVEAHLKAIGRPSTAFAACELRSPKPFTEQGFVDFNRSYVQTLERWGLYKDGRNPVARSNVCPAYDVPPEPSFYAFSYTVPARASRGTFIVAGSGEAPEGKGSYRVLVKGDPGMRVEYEFWDEHGDHAVGGVLLTATRIVNAIPAVCAAAPGLLSALDLPLITGRGLLARSAS